MTIQRRHWIQGTLAAASGAALASKNSVTQAALKAPQSLAKDSVILFQGDSITDAGRNRKQNGANQARALGFGYPAVIAGGLLVDYPKLGLKVLNRGISGNKVPDLDGRWQADCLDLKPDVLSILIGVNDIWHKLNGRYDGTVDVYRDGLKALLERTMGALPKTRVVICEPFVLRCGAVNDSWFPEFEQRRTACREVAASLNLTLVPFQEKFNEAIQSAPPQYWAADGVHPSVAGHALMAKTWRETVGI